MNRKNYDDYFDPFAYKDKPLNELYSYHNNLTNYICRLQADNQESGRDPTPLVEKLTERRDDLELYIEARKTTLGSHQAIMRVFQRSLLTRAKRRQNSRDKKLLETAGWTMSSISEETPTTLQTKKRRILSPAGTPSSTNEAKWDSFVVYDQPQPKKDSPSFEFNEDGV